MMLLLTGINTSWLLPTWQKINSPFVVALLPIDNENLWLPCLLEGNCWQALRSPADLHHERPRWCDWPSCPRPSCSLIHQSTACIRKKTPATSATPRFLAKKLICQSKVWKPKEGGPFMAQRDGYFIDMATATWDWGSWSLSLKLSWISQRKTDLRQPNLTANLALKADNLEEKTDKFDVANLLHPRLNLSYSGDHHGQRRCEAVGETSHHQADHVLLTYSTSGPWCLGRI